ncbi:MAG TPA: hypothetical protein VG496_18405, partial [Myxococcales bacterium]|nr:hypothetical protein [Myxococcales bacterium]
MKNPIVALFSSILLSACMMSHAHAEANTATTRISKAGKYQVTYEPAMQPVPKRQLHSWTIQLRDIT